MTQDIVDALLDQWKARARAHIEALDGHGSPRETQFHVRMAAVEWARAERELTLQRREAARLPVVRTSDVLEDLISESGPT